MKNLLPLLSICIVTGCSTIQRTPEEQTQLIDAAAVVLKSSARGASVLAIEANVKNADYIRLAVSALDTFVVGSDYSPGALAKALAVVIKQTREPLVQLAISSSIDLYEIFYGRYAKGRIADTVAVKFITALRDGAQGALDLKGVKGNRLNVGSNAVIIVVPPRHGGKPTVDPTHHVFGYRADFSYDFKLVQ